VLLAVEERILDALVGVAVDLHQRDNFRRLIRDGEMENGTIEIDLPPKGQSDRPGVINLDASNPGAIASEIFRMAKTGGQGRKSEKKKMTIAEARPILEESESERLLEDFDVIKEAISAVEESGIVFIDEIDKLVSTGDFRGADASSEGVQRDLLPLIEGSTISTKHGNINTDIILFIASGAFHSVKPSDLLAELQGRLPIRVTLKGLSQEDLYKILTEPVTNLIQQQLELLKAENVNLKFTDDAIKEISRVAFEVSMLYLYDVHLLMFKSAIVSINLCVEMLQLMYHLFTKKVDLTHDPTT